MPKYDSVIKGGRLVIPKVGVIKADIGISNGKIAEITKDMPTDKSDSVV